MTKIQKTRCLNCKRFIDVKTMTRHINTKICATTALENENDEKIKGSVNDFYEKHKHVAYEFEEIAEDKYEKLLI